MTRTLCYPLLLLVALSIATGQFLQAAPPKATHENEVLVAVKDDPLQIGCGVASLELPQSPTDLDLFCAQVMPRLQRQIRHAWRKIAPEEADSLRDERSVTILFQIRNDGSLAGTSITHHSGIKALDEASEQAVVAAAPYPPFPEQMKSSKMNVSYTFTYDGPVNAEWLPIDTVIWSQQPDAITPKEQSGFSVGMLLLANGWTVTKWQRTNREYLLPLSNAVEAVWARDHGRSSPQAAIRKSILEARVTIHSDGTMGSISWITLTGDNTVDAAAARNIHSVFPYRPFPSWLMRPDLTIDIYFLYHVSPDEVW